MGTLDGLHVEVEDAVVATDGGVTGVCKGAGLTVAEAGDLESLVRMILVRVEVVVRADIVFVSAEVLTFGSSMVTSVGNHFGSMK